MKFRTYKSTIVMNIIIPKLETAMQSLPTSSVGDFENETLISTGGLTAEKTTRSRRQTEKVSYTKFFKPSDAKSIDIDDTDNSEEEEEDDDDDGDNGDNGDDEEEEEDSLSLGEIGFDETNLIKSKRHLIKTKGKTIVRRAPNSKSDNRPFFFPKSDFTHNFDDNTLPDITISDPNDKVEKTKAFRQLIDFFHENHDGWDTPNIAFTNTTLTKEIKKYVNIIQDANIDFTIDLPLHLYNFYLMSTRNKHLPGFEFAAWPLPSDELITPREQLYSTDFASLGSQAKEFNQKMNALRFTRVNYVENQKRIAPKSSMTCFWHPEIDPKAEMDECMNAIYERKVNRQIAEHARKRADTLKHDTIIQRKNPHDLTFDPFLKQEVYRKLDNVVDQMVDSYINAENNSEDIQKKMICPAGMSINIPAQGMDWVNVLSCLEAGDQRSRLHLLMLFRLQFEKDTLNGPTDRYPSEYENYTGADAHKYKVMKSLINKQTKLKSRYSRKVHDKTRQQLGHFLNLNINN